jgi:hypothetical protein
MLACSDGPSLVLGTGELRRLTSPQGAAVGAGNLAAVTRSADADFALAAHAAEETSLLIDHRPRTGDLSGHGPGVERWSTSEHRLDHRDDPEGSGRLPRAFALSAAPSGYLTRPAPPRKRSQRPRPPGGTEARPRAVAQRVLRARHASALPTACSDAPRARGSAPTPSCRSTTAPPPSPLTTATMGISMTPAAESRLPQGRRQPLRPAGTGPRRSWRKWDPPTPAVT